MVTQLVSTQPGETRTRTPGRHPFDKALLYVDDRRLAVVDSGNGTGAGSN
jgi:hypothetical protein